MKLLLDENLPKRLKNDLASHETHTVRDMGWNGKKNGELIRLMIAEGFDALITFDKNLEFQQNFQKYTLPVVVLNAEDNTYITLSKLVPKILNIFSSELPSGIIEISNS